MRTPLPFVALLGFAALAASTTTAQAQTCDQIRAQIETQTGVLATVNIPLLKSLSLHQGCRFSAAEVYRAAYGDKPLAKANRSAPRQLDRDDD